ncbi:MAG TPA: C-terminal binding protein, partial [Gemmataceae bacterium]|nr:C-terminal binding protein [Gemmataceae bacterium]
MPKRFQVVITDLVTGNPEPEIRILGDLADVRVVAATTEEDLAGKIEDADAVMIYHTMILSRRTIERLRHCKLIVRCGVGYDNIDHVFARSCGIPVANVPDYGTEEVADAALGMALSLMRGIGFLNARLRDQQGEWTWRQVAPLHRLRGRVFGIVGLGRIGTAVAVRAKALRMDVAFFDPYKPDGYDRSLGIRRVETLPDLLGHAHVVSLHCPLTKETEKLINAVALDKMPRGSYLVNTARGAVVDTAALVAALNEGRLGGAAIDVYETEPLPADDPLLSCVQVILTPHNADQTPEGMEL